MATELDIYTGQLTYKGINFSFVFDRNELRLIPPRDKKQEVYMGLIFTQIGTGSYTMGNPSKIDEPYLIGKCNENGHKMVFLTQEGANINSYNCVLFVKIVAYIDFIYDRDLIDRLTFRSQEINCIHPVNQAYEHSFDREHFLSDGVFSVTARDFNSTTTEKQRFTVDNVDVEVQFCISRSMSSKIGDAPISLNSAMLFEFNPTNDYTFLMKLWRIAKQFIQFLCYRKNVFLPTADVSAPYEGQKHEKFATLFVLGESGSSEPELLREGRYIKQSYLSGSEGKILTDIASNLLYTRHFPESYKSGRSIDAARFIMITAAFEWEFHRAYPDGVPKKETTIQVEKIASEAIEKLITTASCKKLKKKYKFLKKLIKSDSLQTEIVKIGEDFHDAIGNFGKRLYSLNDKTLDYDEMGQRLSEQRNHFAHGDLDKDFIGLSLLDLVYMEYIIYAMQLRFYGVDDVNIRKSINELFDLNYAL